MIEHDYYKLLQIEPYSEYSVVKKKYYELALIYHPDKNQQSKTSEEFFKILTQGYNILNNPEQKELYDNALRNYYNYKIKTETIKNKDQSVAEKLRIYHENKRVKIIEEFLRKDNVVTHQKRIVLWILVLISGFFISYNNWFINYLNYSIFYSIIGFIMFSFGIYFVASNLYAIRLYKGAINLNVDYDDKYSVSVFVSLLLGIPVLFFITMNITYNYHLNNFSTLTVPNQLFVNNNSVMYQYRVEGKEILRKQKFEEGKIYAKDKVRVKYSYYNPLISELVFINQ